MVAVPAQFRINDNREKINIDDERGAIRA